MCTKQPVAVLQARLLAQKHTIRVYGEDMVIFTTQEVLKQDKTESTGLWSTVK